MARPPSRERRADMARAAGRGARCGQLWAVAPNGAHSSALMKERPDRTVAVDYVTNARRERCEKTETDEGVPMRKMR